MGENSSSSGRIITKELPALSFFGKTSIIFCSEFVKNMYKCGKNVSVRGEDGNNSHCNPPSSPLNI